jgi:aryl-alcohol dehydrogenase-like predicted oxidoreductase
MKMRKLGNTKLEVSPLCFGSNVFGWTVKEPTAFALLDRMLASGINFIDTADVYSKWVPGNHGGESETMIGNWMKRSKTRDKVIISTKLGMEMAPDRKGLSKAYIFRAVEDSLKRLQTDYIDLYQSHTDDPSTPFEETLGAYAELMRQGKVRAIGASNFNAQRFRLALEAAERSGLPRYETLQPSYNLYDRASYEAELEPLCLEKGIGVINYFALAKGFLTGKYRSEADLSKSPRGGGIKQYLNNRGFSILSSLDKIAAQRKSTPARVALAWQIARPSITSPIASATNVEQLNDLIEATKLDLDADSIKQLNQASAYQASAS